MVTNYMKFCCFWGVARSVTKSCTDSLIWKIETCGHMGSY